MGRPGAFLRGTRKAYRAPAPRKQGGQDRTAAPAASSRGRTAPEGPGAPRPPAGTHSLEDAPEGCRRHLPALAHRPHAPLSRFPASVLPPVVHVTVGSVAVRAATPEVRSDEGQVRGRSSHTVSLAATGSGVLDKAALRFRRTGPRKDTSSPEAAGHRTLLPMSRQSLVSHPHPCGACPHGQHATLDGALKHPALHIPQHTCTHHANTHHHAYAAH